MRLKWSQSDCNGNSIEASAIYIIIDVRSTEMVTHSRSHVGKFYEIARAGCIDLLSNLRCYLFELKLRNCGQISGKSPIIVHLHSFNPSCSCSLMERYAIEPGTVRAMARVRRLLGTSMVVEGDKVRERCYSSSNVRHTSNIPPKISSQPVCP